jgi:hypothetical protein
MSDLIVKIKISQRKKYLIKDKEMEFEELEKKILLAQAREAIERTTRGAKEAGLDKLTSEDINRIIRTARKNA